MYQTDDVEQSGWECGKHSHPVRDNMQYHTILRKIWPNLSSLPNQIQVLNVYPLTLGVFPGVMGEKGKKVFVYGYLLEHCF